MNAAVPPTNFATGIDVEEKTLTWTISNFHVIRKQKALIDSQTIEFEVGESSTGQPIQWNAQLLENRMDKKWIGIYVRPKEPRPTPADQRKYLHGEIGFAITNKTGGQGIIGDEDFVEAKDTSRRAAGPDFFGVDKFIDAEDEGSCPGESLEIKIRFKLYTASQQKSTSSLEAITDKFRVLFLDQARKDFAKLTPVAGTDVKIIANDKKEFSIQRRILAVRSEVFAAMFSSNMSEATSGVINLPDISSNALQVFLHFLNTGDLLREWSDPEVIAELTNAAAKYQLQDLLKFLDLTLGKVCKSDNAIPLIILARQLSLKVAEEELMVFAREEWMGSTESFMKMLNTLTADESDEPDKKKQKVN